MYSHGWRRMLIVIRVCFLDCSIVRLLNGSWNTLGAEGGADCWSRPELPPLNAKKDSISMCCTPYRTLVHIWTNICYLVFQQIDIGNASAQSGPLLRMFGVTEVGEYTVQIMSFVQLWWTGWTQRPCNCHRLLPLFLCSVPSWFHRWGPWVISTLFKCEYWSRKWPQAA